MRVLRYLRHLCVSFFIGVLMFFAPVVAFILFVIIAIPFFVSFTMGLWAAFNGFLWLVMHDQYLRQPTLFWGGVSIVSFALGWVMMTVFYDVVYWLLHPRQPADASLEMTLQDEGKFVR
jgi:hypothetical protein